MSSCPTEQQLAEFHLGVMRLEDQDGVSEHLEHCSSCSERVQRLDGLADPLLAALREVGPRRADTSLQPTYPSKILAPAKAGLPASPPGYEVLEAIGRGGMGLVVKARQIRLNRLVALKWVRTELGPHLLARFHDEAQAVARLQHPNIVQIFEIGEHGGNPFLALEFIPGKSLDRLLDGKPQAPRAAAALLKTLARAIDHAHERGIIHRDLKPANILLAPRLQSATPSANQAGPSGTSCPSTARSGELTPATAASAFDSAFELGDANFQSNLADHEPKITDFGIAKLADETGPTREGDVLGTPGYMAPEQAAGRIEQIGPATDVYSLGVIFYQMLTGRPPFQGVSDLDTLVLVRTQEPVPPRRLQPHVPRDLETICLKCLEKEPRLRYGTALALAEDVERFLAGEPIVARPAGLAERLWKRMRRHPAVAALSVALLAAVIAGAAGIIWNWLDALAQRGIAEQEKKKAFEKAEEEVQARLAATKAQEAADLARGKAEHQLLRADTARYALQLVLVQRDLDDGNLLRARSTLGQCAPALRGWEHRYLEAECSRRCQVLGGRNDIEDLSWSADGARLATASNVEVKVWRADGTELRSISGDGARCVALSADGRLVASVADAFRGAITVSNVDSGAVVYAFHGLRTRVTSLAFLPDAGRVVWGGEDHIVRVWNLANGQTFPLKGHTDAVSSVAVNPEGKRLASASRNGEIHLWNVETGQLILALPRYPARVHRLAFSPDGVWLAAANAMGQAVVWEAATGKHLRSIDAHQGHALAVAFHPRLPRLTTVGRDQWANEWDVTSGVKVRAFRNHEHGALSVAYQPDGNRLAVGGNGGKTCLWDLQPHDGTHATWKTGPATLGLAFRGDTRRVAAGSAAGVAVYDFAEQRELLSHRQHTKQIWGVAFSPDGARVVSGSEDGVIVVWDLLQNQLVHMLKDPDADKSSGIGCIAHHPREPLLATGELDRKIRLWDLAAGKRLAVLTGHSNILTGVAFDPDGKRLASASIDGTVRVWDLASRECRHTLQTEGAARRAVWSRDGRFLAGCGDKSVSIWDLTKPVELPLDLVGHTAHILDAAFHPDGKRLATTGADQSIRLWDLETGQEVLTLTGHRGEVYGIAFSDDGDALLSGSGDGVVKLWQAHKP